MGRNGSVRRLIRHTGRLRNCTQSVAAIRRTTIGLPVYHPIWAHLVWVHEIVEQNPAGIVQGNRFAGGRHAPIQAPKTGREPEARMWTTRRRLLEQREHVASPADHGAGREPDLVTGIVADVVVADVDRLAALVEDFDVVVARSLPLDLVEHDAGFTRCSGTSGALSDAATGTAATHRPAFARASGTATA